MIDQVERKKRLVRWWIGTGSSAIVLAFGGYLLVMRFLLDHNPLREKYWLITGLVLGFGALRLGGQLLRRKYLFDED
jgi:hypothetical protein